MLVALGLIPAQKEKMNDPYIKPSMIKRAQCTFCGTWVLKNSRCNKNALEYIIFVYVVARGSRLK